MGEPGFSADLPMMTAFELTPEATVSDVADQGGQGPSPAPAPPRASSAR